MLQHVINTTAVIIYRLFLGTAWHQRPENHLNNPQYLNALTHPQSFLKWDQNHSASAHLNYTEAVGVHLPKMCFIRLASL